MNGLLGALAGGGMLIFIGVLVLLALRRFGLLSPETGRDILWCAGVTFGVEALYFLAALLLHLAIFADLPEQRDYTGLFRSNYLIGVYQALENPVFRGVLTGLFVYAGHAVGKLLFSQYLSGGLTLAGGCACLAVCLFFFRMKEKWGREWARDGVFFLLCLPCGVFFFLPGGMPLVFLLFALLFFALGKRLPAGSGRRRFRGYWAMLSVDCVLSAFVLTLLTLGRMG